MHALLGGFSWRKRFLSLAIWAGRRRVVLHLLSCVYFPDSFRTRQHRNPPAARVFGNLSTNQKNTTTQAGPTSAHRGVTTRHPEHKTLHNRF